MKEDLKKIRVSFEALLLFASSEQCEHESTHRGGAIWTICDGCGQKWADDRGGFKPYVAPKAFQDAEKALALLKKLEQAQEKSPKQLERPIREGAWKIYIDQQVEQHMKPFYDAYGLSPKGPSKG